MTIQRWKNAGLANLAWLATMSALACLTACGREAPTFAPNAQPGDVAVLSLPAGVPIILDGDATGLVTPDTLRDLSPGRHDVRLDLELYWGWAALPDFHVVTVAPGSTSSATFELSPLWPGPEKTVLLESFSNVSCQGCPELAANVHTLMASPGYGPAKLLHIKYSTGSPQISDPHYQANIVDNVLRYDFYAPAGQIVSIPILIADGALQGDFGSPPDYEGLVTLVDERLAADPGLAIAVSADVSGTQIPVTVTLQASRYVDLSGHTLCVALVENPIIYPRDPPGDQGETVFHWVMRDFAALIDLVSPPGADEPTIRQVTLVRNLSWIPGNLYVIAFVQSDQTRRILQAGSTAGGALRLPSGVTGDRSIAPSSASATLSPSSHAKGP